MYISLQSNPLYIIQLNTYLVHFLVKYVFL